VRRAEVRRGAAFAASGGPAGDAGAGGVMKKR